MKKLIVLILAVLFLISALSACGNPAGEITDKSQVKPVDETEKRDPYPWEADGAKKPSEYTYEEYLDLSEDLQAIFPDQFESKDVFDAWFAEAQDEFQQNEEQNLPDLNGKAPNDFTWEEYSELSEDEQAEFPDYFESYDAFKRWYEEVRPD